MELIAFTGGGVLNFSWSNGNFGMYNVTGPVDTVVTETILPLVSSYPIGLGATFDALAAAETRIMNVYVQGFDANMVIKAVMSGGGTGSVLSLRRRIRPATRTTTTQSVALDRILGGRGTLTISVFTKDPRTDGAQAALQMLGSSPRRCVRRKSQGHRR